MAFIINISKALVVKDSDSDIISLLTTLPSGMHPYIGEATVKLQVDSGTGVEYIKKYLGLFDRDITIIEK